MPPISNNPHRLALAHDWLVGYRGGEAVLERIAALPSHNPALNIDCTRVYTMFERPGALKRNAPHTDALTHTTANINTLPAANRLRRWLLPLYPAAVRNLSKKLAQDHAQNPIDLVVSTSSAAIKGLKPPPGVPHLCYCHSPARYLWDRATEYRQSPLSPSALGLKLFGPSLRNWDRRTADHVTHFLANSNHTANLINRAYDRDADIVFPPARTTFFTPPTNPTREDFWLVVSALEPYKRTDLAIQAAIHARAKLVIVGDGSQRAALQQRAAAAPAGQIEFKGRIDDDALLDLYRRARLLVFPQIEDFGIVAVEAQAAGLPVLARAAGGALDTVIDAQTGAHFQSPTPEAIAEAADRVPSDADQACAHNAARFSEQAFDKAMAQHITDALAARAPTPHTS